MVNGDLDCRRLLMHNNAVVLYVNVEIQSIMAISRRSPLPLWKSKVVLTVKYAVIINVPQTL